MSQPVLDSIDLDIVSIRSSDTAVQAVQQLDSRCFSDGEQTDVASECDRPSTYVWVAQKKPSLHSTVNVDAAQIDGESSTSDVFGYMVAWHVADELHILNIATDPAHRCRGIGSALLSHAIRFAQANEIRLVLLEVRKSNVAAIHLYLSFGFSVLRLRVGYYANNDEDAVEMALSINSETGNSETDNSETDNTSIHPTSNQGTRSE